MNREILKDILETTQFVSDNSKHVKINEDEIRNLIIHTSFKKSFLWLSQNPFGLLDLEVKDIINFLIIYHSIDFSFWGDPKWTIDSNQGKIDGAFALMYVLLKLREKNNHLDCEKISYMEFSSALKGNIEIPLLKERYEIAKKVSEIINIKMQGDFYAFIKDINQDQELLNLIISNFPNFSDTRTYKEKTIYFYKLAQLLVSDILHIKELKENTKVDYSSLVGCADYKILQVLRSLSILEYDQELSNLIDNKIEIPENSEYEIEIRANMLIVINKIKQLLGNKISAIDINDMIWALGQDKTRNLKPYHRTRTTTY